MRIVWNDRINTLVGGIIAWTGGGTTSPVAPGVTTYGGAGSHVGRVSIAVPGTKVPLATVRTMASWVLITADPSNTGYVYVGDHNTVCAIGGAHTYVGCPLDAGNWHIFREVTGTVYIDLSAIYADADNANDTVTYLFYRL